MATVDYALQVTLIDVNTALPIIRCWGPLFEVVDGTPSNPGWHHFIVSFDTSIPRVQMAMDRGGGPILGGSIMDTANGSGEISASGGFPDQANFIPGQMYAQLVATSLNGFTPRPGELVAGLGDEIIGEWEFDADQHNDIEFAYCYFGVSSNFFNLTASNLNSFVTPGLGSVNFGPSGNAITTLNSRFMHTGNTTQIPGIDPPVWQSNVLYNPGDYVVTTEGGLRYWLAQRIIIVAAGRRVVQNIDKNPLFPDTGLSLKDQVTGVTVPEIYFWKEVKAPLKGPEFCWNAANGVLSTDGAQAAEDGLITSVNGP